MGGQTGFFNMSSLWVVFHHNHGLCTMVSSMGNVFKHLGRPPDEKYDLKGSEYKRKVGKHALDGFTLKI
eukprot:UN26202